MAKRVKKKQEVIDPNAHILGAGEVVNQKITETLEVNYMPYAMSVILSRAIPEIDGFKPSHRKLLYTMYKMGLLNSTRIKSANIVGRTMQLNPHGDQAIYDTMVRLSKGYEALIHPYVDSKGNFGKAYSRDMQWAASRYTEAKLSKISSELFRDIDKDTVDFVDNYDSTMKEPTLLPVTFPSVLVNSNTGIAVGMASSICSFNLKEVCETTIALIKNPEHNIMDTLKAPDFSVGGLIVYDYEALKKIYKTGKGGIKVRSRYTYDKANNCIDITEIPPTTTAEAIIDKIIEKVKSGVVREISDVRDETDRSGLKITIDLKRSAEPEKLMAKLFKSTPLEDTFSCNFNVLIGGSPKVCGIHELLNEWTAFRTECVRRRVYYDLTKSKEKLHLLKGLSKILMDIDKAIKIVRETKEEDEVVPNLMIGFGIDEIQAEYVAEIKLRHLNREYILKRLDDIEKLEKHVADMDDILKSKTRIKNIIIKELEEVIKKYSNDRKSEIIYNAQIKDEDIIEEIPDYPVNIFFTKGYYFKKISPQSLRMNSEQKLKEGDEVILEKETTNNREILFFTDKCQVYKSNISEFEDSKASVLGEYVPTKLVMEENENIVGVIEIKDYKGYIVAFYENGKVAKIETSSYETKTKRKKLIKALSDKSPVVSIIHIDEDKEIVIESSAGRHLLFNTATITSKTTKSTIGVGVMTLKKGQKVISVNDYVEGQFKKPYRYRTKNLPALGAFLSSEDNQVESEQLTL